MNNKACIICIGNELLNGQTVNTNAAWLSGQLFQSGIPTIGSWTVPDEQPPIVAAIQRATADAGLVLITGGLGPTQDDVTRQAVAAFLETDLQFHPELLNDINNFFQNRGKPMPPVNRSQAYIPVGAIPLPNTMGTAPGFWIQRDNARIAVLPGVPSEMEHMFTEQVMPRITDRMKGPVVAAGKLRCMGASESDIAQKLADLMKRGRNPLVNCTCGSGEIILHIVASAADKKTAQTMIEADKHLLQQCLGNCVYGQDDQTLPEIVGRLLRAQHRTIALAESCTGGLLSKMLTDIPGASEYVKAGWVTYSNEAKVSQLGVPEDMITEFGAVSEPVARRMAQQAACRSGADVAVSITGIAGPGGGSDEKPVGQVFIATVMDGQCQVQKFQFPPANRHWIRLRSAMTALNCIRLRLQV